MSEVAASGSIAALPPVLARLPYEEEAFLLIEQAPTVWLEETERTDLRRFERVSPAASGEGYDVGDLFAAAGDLRWDVGRLFTWTYEVRWDRQMDTVIYVGADRALPDLAPVDIALDVSRVITYSLWGRLVDTPRDLGLSNKSVVYADLRLPRPLRYPTPSNPTRKPPRRLRLSVREYLDAGSGQVALSRFCGCPAISSARGDDSSKEAL